MASDPSAIPELCQAWLERCFGAAGARHVSRASAPWTAERVVAWTYLVVDIAVRDVCVLVLKAAGAEEQAARHRALPRLFDSASAGCANAQLGVSMKVAKALGLQPLFFGSTQRAVEDAARLDETFQRTALLEPTFLAGIFGVSAALDMSVGRGASPTVCREDLLGVYRARLIASLDS